MHKKRFAPMNADATDTIRFSVEEGGLRETAECEEFAISFEKFADWMGRRGQKPPEKETAQSECFQTMPPFPISRSLGLV